MNLYTFSRIVRDVEFTEIEADSIESARRELDECTYEAHTECLDGGTWQEGDQPFDAQYELLQAAKDLLAKWESGNLSESIQNLQDAVTLAELHA